MAAIVILAGENDTFFHCAAQSAPTDKRSSLSGTAASLEYGNWRAISTSIIPSSRFLICLQTLSLYKILSSGCFLWFYTSLCSRSLIAPIETARWLAVCVSWMYIVPCQGTHIFLARVPRACTRVFKIHPPMIDDQHAFFFKIIIDSEVSCGALDMTLTLNDEHHWLLARKSSDAKSSHFYPH